MNLPEGLYPAGMNTSYWESLFEWEGARQYALWVLRQDAGAALAHAVAGIPVAAWLRSLGLVDRWSMLLSHRGAHGHLAKPRMTTLTNAFGQIQ